MFDASSLALGPAWDLTFTLRNDGGAQRAWVAIHEAPVIFDLMFTQWVGEPWLEAGETRDMTVRIDWSLPWTIPIVPTDWICLQVDSTWPPNRCWSVLIAPGAHTAYPEDIAHWQLLDVQYGDGPQR